VLGKKFKKIHELKDIDDIRMLEMGDAQDVLEIESQGKEDCYCDFADPIKALETVFAPWNPELAKTYVPDVKQKIAERTNKLLEQKKAEEAEVTRLEDEIRRLEAEYAAYEEELSDEDEDSDEEEYVGMVRVLHDYEADEDNELNLKAGETIGVLQKHESGWWKGENFNGEIGLFPVTYCSVIKDLEQEDEANGQDANGDGSSEEKKKKHRSF